MYSTKIIKKHWILCCGHVLGKPVARLVSFGKDHEWQFAHISQEGDFLLINSLKRLFLIKWNFDAAHLTLGSYVTLPKNISHGYSESKRIFLFDKAGDIYSQTFDKLREEISFPDFKDNITEEIQLETSNFCAAVAMSTGKVLGHEVVAISDQYYKIRLIHRADYHRMLMSISLRTKYAENLVFVNEKRLLVYYVDGKMQLLDDAEILHSSNVDNNYVEHPFLGHLAFIPVEGHPFTMLVHCLDSDELQLAHIDEKGLKIAALSKKSLKAEKTSLTQVFASKNHFAFVRVPDAEVEAPQESADGKGISKELACETVSIDLQHNKFN